MRKYIYNLASWFLDKDAINELKENSEGNIVDNISEACNLKKSEVITHIVARIILQLIRYSLAIYLGYYFLYFAYHLIYYYTLVDSLMFIYVTGLFITLVFLLIPLKKFKYNFLALFLGLTTFYLTTIYYNSLEKETNETLLQRETLGVISGKSSKIVQIGGDPQNIDVNINFINQEEVDSTNLYSNSILTYEIGSAIDYTNWKLKYEVTNNFSLPNYLKKRRDFTQYDVSYAFVDHTDEGLRLVYDNLEGIYPNTPSSDKILAMNYAYLVVNPNFKVKVIIGKNESNKHYVLTFDNINREKISFSKDVTLLNCFEDNLKLPEDYQSRLFNRKASCDWTQSERSFVVLPSDSYFIINKN